MTTANIEKGTLVAAGKAKEIYETSEPGVLWVHNLNQATSLNGKHKEVIENKAYYTNAISGLLFKYLADNGIPNHLIEQLNDTDALVQALDMIRVEVVTRNYAAGHFASNFGVEPMTPLSPTVQEFYYKSDALDDPVLNDSQILALGLATSVELISMRDIALKVNELLLDLFNRIGITFVDFKVEFGRTTTGSILLADELSPDNMRLIDQATGASLDKDIFRKGTGDLREGYGIVLARLETELNN